jgi:nucleoside-diphosphate-sugar epimerase
MSCPVRSDKVGSQEKMGRSAILAALAALGETALQRLRSSRPLFQRPGVLSLRHFHELQATSGTLLRIAFDLGTVWVALIIGWFTIAGGGRTGVLARVPAMTVLFIGMFSVLASLAYTAGGLYTCNRTYTLSTKIRQIVSVNAAFFLVAGMVSSFVAPIGVLKIKLFFCAFAGSTFLLCLARTAFDILRTEERRAAAAKEPGTGDANNVLVIGGAGYIGSALVEKLLCEGLRIRVLDAMHFGEEPLRRVAGHRNLRIIREDFRNFEVLTRAMHGMGAVVHLGGLVGDPACAVDPDLTVDVNVTATKVIGEIAKAEGVSRFIFASSCSVYGTCDDIVDEESPFNPQSLYARSKVASEVVLNALNSSEFAVTCLRFATIYGMSRRTRFDLVVNLLCAKAVREGLITVFGADQWRPFVHVEDVALAIFAALRAPIERVAGEAFNVGSDPQNYTLGDIAKLVKAQVPTAKIVSDDSFDDKRNYRVSFEKIGTRLGFKPMWTIERGIAQVIALVGSNQIGHYSMPAYNNVVLLKERGIEGFTLHKITGWENNFMNTSQILRRAAKSERAAAGSRVRSSTSAAGLVR